MSSLNLYVLILVYILPGYHFDTPIEGVKISTNQGPLKGESKRSRNGTEYFVFLAVPYAKPPIGELRFEPPQEPDNWTDVRDAQNYPPSCLQIHGKKGKFGKEDCLYLNVFTPYKSVSAATKKLPTIVYVHGGGMIYGTPDNTDPKYFMDHCIVFVNFQYRLNIFGFGSNGDEIFPGNYGMKDQVAALKWVQKNIAAFGGDPNRVTLVGHSSAAANVHLHMHSPLSQGLFQQAISQSGSGLSSWAVTSVEKIKLKMAEYAEKAKCSPESSSELLKCLRKIDADDLMLYHDSFKTEFASKKPFPVVVESTNVKDPFLITNPWLQDTLSEVPWITGLTSGEGGYKAIKVFLDQELLKNFDDNYKKLFPEVFNYDWMSEKMASETSEKLRKFYFNDDSIDKNPEKLVDMYTDSYFALDTIEAAKRYKGKLYTYLYDHRNVNSFNDHFGEYKGIERGVCHADELFSFFYLPWLPEITVGPDFQVSERVIKYWVNFVTNGDPNGDEKIWQPVQSDELEYLHIKTHEDVMAKNLWIDRYNFWKSLSVFRKFEILGKKSNSE